jgi:hypothetical protein
MKKGKYFSREHDSKHDWLTDPSFIEIFGDFDLDPACPVDMPWKTATTMLTQVENGLLAPWKGRVWLNPPYGFKIVPWLKRMSEHNNGIALVPRRTETRWFRKYVWECADSFIFPSKPIAFFQWKSGGKTRPVRRNTTPTLVVAYGQKNGDVLSRVAPQVGWYLDNTFSKIIQLVDTNS